MNRYFYIDTTGKQRGTFSPDELRVENIKRDTLVWTQGMEQWRRADEVEGIRQIFEVPHSPNKPPYLDNRDDATVIEPMPKTWLVESLLVTILPFALCGSFLSLIGIIAIVYATQVESHFTKGDYRASVEASRSAGKWTKITLWILIAWVILIAVAFLFVFVLLGYNFTNMGDLINT